MFNSSLYEGFDEEICARRRHGRSASFDLIDESIVVEDDNPTRVLARNEIIEGFLHVIDRIPLRDQPVEVELTRPI